MIILNGMNLTLEKFLQITEGFHPVGITEGARKRVRDSRKRVEDILAKKTVVYGVNTGFGKLSDHRIMSDDLETLQENLLKSHACGTGDLFDETIVRGMMLLRINALITGHSGVREVTIDTMLAMLNKNVVPVVYEKGSLGASGDLVPLAHMALPLIGLGEAFFGGKRMAGKEAMMKAGIKPLDGLQAKEGLALINGTQGMTSVAAHALINAEKAFEASYASSALTFEALKGITDVFDERVHLIRNQVGQIEVARTMRLLLIDSGNTTHQGEDHTQDAYALRCVPQVHGPTLETLRYVRERVEREMNAATDNPVVLDDGKAVSAGNFHGQAVALVMDYLSIAMSELANITERRIERLVNPALNRGLPAFLVEKKGLNSGFMIIQYVAASLVSENKGLAHPASVDSIPSSGNQEDHVSMGTISARRALTIVEHATTVVGLELMSASQALDFRGSGSLSKASQAVYNTVRKHIPFIHEDTVMQPYIETMHRLVKTGTIAKEIEPWLSKTRH